MPSNILLIRFKRPSYYLGFLVVAWGTVMTLTGLVNNMAGLAACRAFLGVFEYVRTFVFLSLTDSESELAFSPRRSTQ